MHDFIAFSNDPTLMVLIKGEKLLFADKIKKTNMFEWTQERTFVVTHLGIYNIHKKTIKRNILIKDIGGLTKTRPPSKAMEFTVHVPSSYDYRFSSQRRDQIIDLLKRLCIIVQGQNCPVFCTDAKDLQGFTTTESDMKKGRSRFPLDNLRDFREDLFVEQIQ